MITLQMTSSRRRQPLFNGSHRGGSGRKAGTHLGEAVGGAAAVCCCCPCGLANVVFLAIYKLPASLCRRALQSHKQRRGQRLARKEGMNPVKRRGCSCGCGDDLGIKIHPEVDIEEVMKKFKGEELEEEQDMDVVELEKEMWENFYSTGFWRSCSRRGEDSSPSTQRMFSIVSVSD